MNFFLLASTLFIVGYLACMSPWPDVLLVLKNSILYGRKQGVVTAFGIASGLIIHVSYCIFGLATLISTSIVLYTIIKIVGAIYLFYIAWQLFTIKKADVQIVEPTDEQKNKSIFQGFREGFLCNALNPKATLFFLAIFSQFLTPNMIILERLILWWVMILAALAWFIPLAFLLTIPKVRKQLTKIQYVFSKIMGFALAGLGLKILFSTKN